MKTIKTILITGGTGFIGSHLISALLENKYKIVALKRNSSNLWRVRDFIDNITFVNSDETSLTSIFEKHEIDCIVHLATLYKKEHESDSDVKNMVRVNIEFPSLLLECARKYNVQYFINTGSFFEYDFESKESLSEESPIKAYNLYASTKIAFENILHYYSYSFRIKSITLKLFAPYGEKDNPKLVRFLIENMLKNQAIEMTKGEQIWDFTYVANIVDAYLKTLIYIQKMENVYDYFNIGNGNPISIKEMVEMLKNIGNKDFTIHWGAKEYAENEIFFAKCNNKKARTMLSWKPQYDIKKGLEKTYHYYLREEKDGNL